jgi:Tfp pilus assembly protein PilX
MRHSWRSTFDNERGSVLLIAILVVAIMSLLGVALFKLSTIEAGLVARGDVGDAQAFYCAEAALAYTYKDSTKTTAISPANLAAGATLKYVYPPDNSGLHTKYGAYTMSAVATGNATTPTVTGACVQENGVTRIVQAGLNYPNSIYEFAVVSGNSSAPGLGFGNFYLGGTGIPTKIGGPYVGGADSVSGDIYVSNIAFLRGAPTLSPCHSSDCDPTNKNPQLTATCPDTILGPCSAPAPPNQVKGLINTSTTFDPSAPGAFGTTGLNPMPDVSSVVSTLRTAVGRGSAADPATAGQMTGTYNGSTVYNLTKIFATLGSTSEGNNERNLAKPSGCTFGSPTTDPNCQVWQDLIYAGVKRTTADPGPSDAPSYYFMGIPVTSPSPQGTSNLTVYNALVNASPELQQMGFMPGNLGNGSGSLQYRLAALAGQDSQNFLASSTTVSRLVDLTMGTNAQGQAVERNKAPIFFIDDGYFRVEDGVNFAYNGIGTIITSKSILLADNIIYLNGTANQNTGLPGSCSNNNDRTNCGLPDVLGLVAQNDIWVGDPGASGATVEWLSGVMLAGRDVNYLGYNSSSACCQGVSNPVTLNGTVMATRQASLARDWSDPQSGHANDTCNTASSGGCRPVEFYPNDSSCGVQGCWKYLKIDTNTSSSTYGALIPDPNYASFQGCETVTACTSGRRITHFQLNVNYEHRLWHNSALIPPGLPTGNSTLPVTLVAGTWKECDSRYYPGASNSLFDSNNRVKAACP